MMSSAMFAICAFLDWGARGLVERRGGGLADCSNNIALLIANLRRFD
jgi:hypothetical protein